MPITPYALLNHFEGDDESIIIPDDEVEGVTWTFEVSGAGAIDTDVFKWGNASIRLPQNPSLLNYWAEGANVVVPEDASWTVEGWARWDTAYAAGNNWTVSIGNDSDGATVSIWFEGDGDYFFQFTNGVQFASSGVGGSANNTDTWYHFAFTRNAGTDMYDFFWNGNRVIQYSNPNDSYPITWIRLWSKTNNSNVWWDDVRITPGLALYDDDTYTVPDGPFPDLGPADLEFDFEVGSPNIQQVFSFVTFGGERVADPCRRIDVRPCERRVLPRHACRRMVAKPQVFG